MLAKMFVILGHTSIVYSVSYYLLHTRAIYHTLYHIGHQLMSAIHTLYGAIYYIIYHILHYLMCSFFYKVLSGVPDTEATVTVANADTTASPYHLDPRCARRPTTFRLTLFDFLLFC